MKKVFLTMAVALGATGIMRAQDISDAPDSVRLAHLGEVVVKAVTAGSKSPFAVSTVRKDELDRFAKTGQELPMLFARTPGVMAWSDNGLGIGTSYLRIRGAGDSRINVTIDGVPLNSPEDQCVFWANMNSYAALLGNVQIQRGVGTSTNGDGAFGGTVSLSTRTPSLTPGGEMTSSYGSYNTWRVGGSFSTGLMGRHWVVDGALHQTTTDGFVNGTDGRSGSYYGGATWMGDRLTVRYKNIGNFEHTGQAYNGVIAGDYDGYAPLHATYGELYRMGYGRWNSTCQNIYAGSDGVLHADPYIMADGSAWRHAVDHFWQNHNILSAAWQISSRWSTTASLHYTHGYGYYRDLKYNCKLSKFGLPNFTKADGSTLKRTDFVRRKGLKQDLYGLVWSANYKDECWDIVGGLNSQHFEANHFGYLSYMKDSELAAHYLTAGDYRHYDSDATKDDMSAYLKATLSLTPEWSIFGDVQYRHVLFMTGGYNDKYNSDLSKNLLDINRRYDFVNPKAGVTYACGGHKAYASVAMSHREPERNNFTDNAAYPAPVAERLADYELGYKYASGRWHAAANLYYMDYTDQFVQTGALSDIGEALTTNIKSSYRMGVEMEAGLNITNWLSLDGNIALSQNRIKNFDEVVSEVYDADWNSLAPVVNHYDHSTLAYSPSFVGNAFATIRHKGLRATWRTGGASRQYVDNSASRERSVPGYCTSDASASCTFSPGRPFCGLRQVEIGVNVCNVFNRHYAASGFVWYQSIVDGRRSSQMSYVPCAGTTVMGSMTLRF